MDVFGEALLDYQSGQRDQLISITRDDDFVDTHSVAMYFEADPFPFEALALEHVKGPVLDIGCGAGRHLLWFERMGIKAAGLDCSPGAIEVSKARGCKNAYLIDIMSDDWNTPAQTFTLFGNNVGIGRDFDGAIALFRKLRQIAKKDGQLVLTGLDIANTTNPYHLAYHARNLEMGRKRGEIQMRLTYQGKSSAQVPWYHPEPDEVYALATASGWQISTLKKTDNGFFWAVLKVDHEIP